MPTCALQVKVSKIVGRVQAGYSNHQLHFIDNDDKTNMPPMWPRNRSRANLIHSCLQQRMACYLTLYTVCWLTWLVWTALLLRVFRLLSEVLLCVMNDTIFICGVQQGTYKGSFHCQNVRAGGRLLQVERDLTRFAGLQTSVNKSIWSLYTIWFHFNMVSNQVESTIGEGRELASFTGSLLVEHLGMQLAGS